MKCVIISEEKLIDLGKRCLSNLRDFVNNEYYLRFNEVKRLRTIYFMTCKKVFGEQLKSKEYNSLVFNNLMKYQNTDFILQPDSKEKENLLNEVWNEKIEEKYCEAKKYCEAEKNFRKFKIEEIFKTPMYEKYFIKSKIEDESKNEDESKIEEVFNTPVCEKYSRMEFSLEETIRIFELIKDGLYNCQEIYEDLYYEIKNFNYIYEVYNFRYNSLDRD